MPKKNITIKEKIINKEYYNWIRQMNKEELLVWGAKHLTRELLLKISRDIPIKIKEKELINSNQILPYNKEKDRIAVKVYTDGATQGLNRGFGSVNTVGLGVFIPELNIRKAKKTDGLSNNEAEFKALIWALNILIDKRVKNVKFFLDSQIVINRARGKNPKLKKYKNERMDAFQGTVLRLLKYFDYYTFKWIPREKNTVADKLSRKKL